MNWFVAAVLLLTGLNLSAAIAEDVPVETVTVNVTNTPVRGDVLLEKTGLQLVRFADEQDEFGYTVMKPVHQNGYLADAVFELRAAEDIVGKEGTVFYHQGDLVETLTTSASGAVKSKILPLGQYELREISAPDGYVFDTAPYSFTLSAADKKTAVVEVRVSAANTYLPIRVTLRKQKEAIRVDETAEGMIHQSMEVVPGEGFVFGLFTSGVMTYGDNQKLPANTLVATGVTDATGSLTFSGLYPHGNYYIKELSVPAGWHLSTEQYPVKLTPENKVADENVIAVSLDEPILNRLIYTPVTITKKDITGAETLPGALVGFVADFVGCLFSGYGYNPMFCVPPILYGLAAGLFQPMLVRKTSVWTIALAFLPAITLGSILWQSFALAFVYGGDAKTAFFLTKLASRSIQFGVTFVIDAAVVWLLYRSKVFTAAKLWPPVKYEKKSET